jgi:transcriptional regulator with XRE-family HTH domain
VLAEETNIHCIYIARVEGCKAVAVSVEVFDQIARALKTDLIFLLQPPDDSFPKRLDSPKTFSRGRVSN